MASRHYRPLAPPEIVAGYARTAALAEQRAERVAAWGDEVEAAAWRQVAAYCREMAARRALDDDQFPDQARRLRHRREQPLSEEVMDSLALRRVDTMGEAPPLHPYLEAILELALGYLSPMQHVCFELVVGGRLTAREVAEAIGGTPAEIRSQLSRARKTLEEKVVPRLAHLLPDRKRWSQSAGRRRHWSEGRG